MPANKVLPTRHTFRILKSEISYFLLLWEFAVNCFVPKGKCIILRLFLGTGPFGWFWIDVPRFYFLLSNNLSFKTAGPYLCRLCSRSIILNFTLCKQSPDGKLFHMLTSSSFLASVRWIQPGNMSLFLSMQSMTCFIYFLSLFLYPMMDLMDF